MRPTPDVFPAHDSSLDDLLLLDVNGESEAFDVEGGAQVELAARDADDVPYDLRVTNDGTPLHTATVDTEFFAPGEECKRFVTVAGRRLAGVADVDEAAATAALETVLEEIRDRFVADEVHVVDEKARDVLRKTAAVTYSPNGNGALVVTFADVDFAGNTFAYHRSQMTISSRQWSNTSSAPNLPRVQGIQRAFNGAEGRDRWRTVRRAWMAMADDGGDTPPVEVAVTADDLRERGTVPKIGVGLDAVRDAVHKNRKFDDVREELGVSRPREKILQGALERLDLDSDVKYGMMPP